MGAKELGMSWLHGTTAGLCCIMALLSFIRRQWGAALHWFGTGCYALTFAIMSWA